MKSYEIAQSIEVLSATPRVLSSLLGKLSDEWTLESNTVGTWSAFDVIGHLIHGEETDWIPRARIIRSGAGDCTFVPFDRFAQLKKSKGKTIQDLLDEFTSLRAENIRELEAMNLTRDDLKQTGIHPELGEVTLQQLLATWVVHDLNHIRQISVILAKRYRRFVGAWDEYLTILN